MSPAPLSPLITRPLRLLLAVASVVLVAALAVGCAGGGLGGGAAAPTSEAVPPSDATTSGVPTTTTTTAPTTTTVATTTTTAPLDPNKVTEVGPLRSGSLGLRTKAVQQALRDQHYDPGAVDGRFGLKTTMAVWAFQQLNGLAPDGVVGPATEAKVLARPVQQMLRPALGPTHTEVDLRRQVMLVWRGGVPVLITHVSTGSQVPYCTDTKVGRHCGDAVTHVGVFRFGRRVSGWREAALGRLYNPVYFDGGIAVHGAASVPNHPASHGCVRIPMSIAEYFPSLVNTGDPIEVFRS